MGFGPRGTEGKIAAVRYAREKQGAVLRHLLRHADGGDRVRAPRLRPRARQLDRGRSEDAAPGDRPDARRSAGVTQEGRHDAARRLSVRARARARSRASSTASSKISSATAIATSSTTPTASSSRRAGLVCSRRRRPTAALVEMVELADHPVVPRQPVPPRVQVAARSTAIRCSRASSAPRSQHGPRGARRRCWAGSRS